jgi:hypothetical protein
MRVKMNTGEIRDEIRQPLFDTVLLTEGENPVGVRSFFSEVQGKPAHASNLRQNNILESAVSYRIMGISFDAMNLNIENEHTLRLLAENSSLKLRIGEKNYLEVNTGMITGGVETKLAGYAVGQTLFGPQFIQKAHVKMGGAGISRIQLDAKSAIDIAPLQSFSVDWEISGAPWGLSASEVTLATIQNPQGAFNTRIKFVCTLRGLMRRPVQ